ASHDERERPDRGPSGNGCSCRRHRSVRGVSVRSSPACGGGIVLPPSHEPSAGERCDRMSGASGRVLVVGAHPDDPDFLAGGTVARLAKEGREIAYVILTNGNKGSGNRSVTSEQLAPIPGEEQRRAAHVLGVTHVEFLGYEDGELEDTRELRRDVTREIRRWRPDLIITLNPHRTYNNFPGWHRED